MQLIVLGMHRSGTSVLARLLNMMGAYFGPEGISTGANQENPKGFWERKDVRALNDYILNSVGCDWDKIVDFNLGALPDEVITEFRRKASKIVLEMDAHRPWLLKEPRLCLLFNLWKELLEVPVCIHIIRNPVEVAHSLQKRNGIPINTGIALWEKYNISALEASHELPRIIVSHNRLMTDLVAEVKYLYEQLVACGVDRLRLPSEKEITSFVRTELYRERVSADTLSEYLNSSQLQLFEVFENGQAIEKENNYLLSETSMLVLKQYEQEKKKAKRAQAAASKMEAEFKSQLEQKENVLNEQLRQKAQEAKRAQESASKREAELQSQLEQKEKNLTEQLKQKAQVAKRAQEAASKREAELLNQLEQKEKDLTQQLKQKVQEVKRAQEAASKREAELLNQLEQKEKDLTQQLKQKEKELLRRKNDVDIQNKFLMQLIDGINALIGSRRWKVGNALFSLRQKLFFKPVPPLATDYIAKVINRYELWKKDVLLNQVADSIDSGGSPHDTKDKEIGSLKISEIPETYHSVDIIVCVHNALDDVKKCLNSILVNTPQLYNLYIINDGSESKTTEYLHNFAKVNENVTLLENQVAQGYTKAANKGLRASTADYVVLLNSDTVVPRLWINALIDCGESDSNIGIVGPLSNAASWQSVPARFDDDSGDWAINELPNGYDVDQMAELVYQLSERHFPRVSFVNGFCFAIKRSVIDRIGYLDEEAFPKGYGEENDYCLRAINAGFSLAIADHGYVYHSKSKSYSHARRGALSKEGSQALKLKHGTQKINDGTKVLKESKTLADIRKRLCNYLQGKVPSPPLGNKIIRILFVMPVRGGGGGAHSVVQEVTGMRALGVDAKIANIKEYENYFNNNYPKQYSSGDYFLFYKNNTELHQLAVGFDVVVATLYTTPAMIEPIVRTNPAVLTAYYIQDYEPWFFEEGTEKWRVAFDSYTCVPNMLLFAKTQWLCSTVKDKHQRLVHKVKPSIDHDIYYPSPSSKPTNGTITISAMVRPNSPRRAPLETLLILTRVKETLGDEVSIIIFGCNNDELELLKEGIAQPIDIENRGVLTQGEVADLLRKSDIFIDFSTYQAFGRTGLEAMACGCAVILPAKGGVSEYAIHEDNSLIVDTNDEGEMLKSLMHLIENDELRMHCQQRGIETSESFSIGSASLSELSLFRMALAEKTFSVNPKIISKFKEKSLKNKEGGLIRIAVWPCVMGDGVEPAGSAYIRLLQTLRHPSLNDKLGIQIVSNLEDLKNTEADICVVQRNAIKNTLLSVSVIKFCQSQNIKLVHEIDDDLFRMHESGHKSLPKEELAALKLIIRSADRVVTSSSVLRDSLKHWNANTVCVPNAHDENLWLDRKGDRYIQPKVRGGNTPLRILYMGTRTHAMDLGVIKEAWERIEKEYGKEVVFEVVGGVSVADLDFGQHYGDFKSGNYPEFVAWLRKQKRWHIGVIPLSDTDFNRKKSYIKYLDYAALGLPIICSDIEPYRIVARNRENALIVKNTTEAWYQALKCLIDDNNFRLRLGKAAFQDLTKSYCLEKHAVDFLSAYRDTLLTKQ